MDGRAAGGHGRGQRPGHARGAAAAARGGEVASPAGRPSFAQRGVDDEHARRVEAERVGRLKDEFLANLSHELRTPVNAILGWASLLKPGQTPEQEMAEGLAVIRRNAQAQAQLIEDLLDMSRITAGKLRLEAQRVEMPDVIAAALDSLRLAADAKGVSMAVVLDPVAGPVLGDAARLQQVVWNLVSNAIKFTPAGGRVLVTLERSNGDVEVSVSDTGRGIAPDFLPHVFDRFSQADGPGTKRHSGLGLGLSIAKHLSEMHGGTVRVKSAGCGQGATFTLSLPVASVRPVSGAEPGSEADGPSGARAARAAEELALPDLSGVRALIVDDDAEGLKLVDRLLRVRGIDVTACGSAPECLARLRDRPPEVLVADISMPGQDGYTLIREVRALPPDEGGATPAVALTVFARSADRRRAMLAGFDVHVAKPVEAEELLAVIARLSRRA